MLRRRPPIAVAALLACATLVGLAHAEVAVSVERVSFRVADAFEKGTGVTGELRIPDANPGRLPAVVIVDSTPGFDGRGRFHAEGLNAAGIATLEIDVFEGKGQPATPRHNLPHVYESLAWLASHSRVDPARVGIMGFSSGGMLTVLASSEPLARQYGGVRRYAAHLAFYPHCWFLRRIPAGTLASLEPGVFADVTGRPVRILLGDKDDYESPESCRALIDALPAQARGHVTLTVYPGATFAWDSVAGSTTYNPNVNGGRGGMVTVVADREIAAASRDDAVAYFRKHLNVE